MDGGEVTAVETDGALPVANGSGSHQYAESNPMYSTTIRHGFGVISEEWMSYLAEGFCYYFADKRHDTGGVPRHIAGQKAISGEWRITDRHRTVNAALVLCLNLGVDPPDIVKTKPCAKVEAGVVPSHAVDMKKALEKIGKNLQTQYETLSTRTKYKQSLDPNVDDAKRFCMGLRRSARDDRILFHYNGHGVPRPTASGEIWVFNRGYTQYIPVSVYELQTWLGAPVIYCYDCSGAGNIVKNFNDFVEKRKRDERRAGGPKPEDPQGGAAAFSQSIQMGACRADEILPMNPDLPADLFTCCITTPVDIAVKWFLLQNGDGFQTLKVYDLVIPGKVTDRRTPLGELNWIFTAITDTIAWSALEPAVFKRLFRQDLVVAAMFRNFLLACRIMQVHGCHPISSPELPETHDHPLWKSWDLAVSQCLLQLDAGVTVDHYEFSNFFEQQLTAFEMWLTYRSADVSQPPEQLPVLLQVLLSQIHRLRALLLLARYLDLGPQAVRISLSIGFFIYVLKLLQSPAAELKPVLVFIWARIMAADYKDVQHELVKENGYQYFIQILVQSSTATDPSQSSDGQAQSEANGGDNSTETRDAGSPPPLITDVGRAEHLAMCCFVLAQFARGFPQGQQLLAQEPDLIEALTKEHKGNAESPLFRQWASLLSGIIMSSSMTPLASAEKLVPRLLARLKDPIPEVRAAALVALRTSIHRFADEKGQADLIAKAALIASSDMSIIVREEYALFAARYIQQRESHFLVCAFTTLEEEYAAAVHEGDLRSTGPAHGTIALATWRCLLVLSTDPAAPVRSRACEVVDKVNATLMRTPLADDARRMIMLLNPEDHINGSSRPIFRRTSSSGSTSAALDALNGQRIQDNEAQNHQNQHQGIRAVLNWVTQRDEPPTPPPDNPEPVRRKTHLRAPPSAGYNPAVDDVGTVPVEDMFYDWCVEYFTEPQLHGVEADVPGSQRYLARLYRKERNERIMVETQVQKGLAVTGNWGTSMGNLKAPAGTQPPTRLTFAQFEPHLAASNSNGDIVVYDWASKKLLNTFCGSEEGIPISDVKYINEDDYPLLLTAAADGVARVFRRYESADETDMVGAWSLLADLPRAGTGTNSSDLVVDWQQSRGSLLAGGDVRVIRIWDAAREAAVTDLPVRTSSILTSLTSDQVTGNLCVGGFSDGSLNVYDRRLPRNESLVRRWRAGGHHRGPVISVRMQRGGPRELVSGSVDGSVNLWDIRLADPVVHWQAHTREMRCLDVHEHAPVVVTGSRVVGVWSTSGRRVSTIKCPTSSYLAPKMSPVGALVFHPHRMILAMNNCAESTVSLFQCSE